MAGANLWYVGVMFEIVSTMSGTVGKQLIRLSELRKRKNPRMASTAFYTGIVVNTALGPLIDMAAYSFAAQSLIAPFGGLDVVWNALLAPYLLKETMTARRLLGCGLIVLGTGAAGAFGNHNDSEYTVEYLEDTLVNVRVLIYFAVFLGWFLLNRFVLMQYPKGSALRGISLGCTAGTLAGNMFCVKASIELIQRSIHEQDGTIWLHWLPYVLIAGAAFFALSNVVYMTRGLQEYEALFMVTIYEGSMIVSGCVSGAIVLLDLKGLEAWRVAMYSLGVLLIVMGMYVIFSEEEKQTSSYIAGSASIATEAKMQRASPMGSNESLASVRSMRSLRARYIHASSSLFDQEQARVSSPKSPKRYCSWDSKGAEPLQEVPVEPPEEAEAVDIEAAQVGLEAQGCMPAGDAKPNEPGSSGAGCLKSYTRVAADGTSRPFTAGSSASTIATAASATEPEQRDQTTASA